MMMNAKESTKGSAKVSPLFHEPSKENDKGNAQISLVGMTLL